MSERAATPPIPGLLTGFVTPSVVPLTVAYFAAANTLTRVSFRVTDKPSGGSVTVELNTASDGSGDSISATIADGTDFITATGSVDIAAGGYLYMRVTAESGSAMNLSGEYEVTQSSGVATMLTTLARVKLDLDISTTDADRDTLITNIISGVSKQMQDWMDRPITETTTTGEQIDSDGSDTIQTRGYPIISVASLTEDDTALVEDTDFEMNEHDLEAGQIVRISGGRPYNWTRGRRVVTLTYNHGYSAVPASLVDAATSLTIARYFETGKSGRGRRGLASKDVEPGASATYDKSIWERETIFAMQPYRKWTP